MSTTATGDGTSVGLDRRGHISHPIAQQEVVTSGLKNYKGFVAGVFSGIAKLTGVYEEELARTMKT